MSTPPMSKRTALKRQRSSLFCTILVCFCGNFRILLIGFIRRVSSKMNFFTKCQSVRQSRAHLFGVGQPKSNWLRVIPGAVRQIQLGQTPGKLPNVSDFFCCVTCVIADCEWVLLANPTSLSIHWEWGLSTRVGVCRGNSWERMEKQNFIEFICGFDVVPNDIDKFIEHTK